MEVVDVKNDGGTVEARVTLLELTACTHLFEAKKLTLVQDSLG